MSKWLKYFLFAIVLIYTTMWTQTRLLLESVGRNKVPITIVVDESLNKLVKEKTGVDIGSVKISESERPFGMMAGLPPKPQFILSRGLYDTFSHDELEYVAFHEAGHYALWHNVKELTLGIILFVFGVLFLRKVRGVLKGLFIAFVLGIFFGVVMIQQGKAHELEVDRYSLQRMTNPEGMITATEKFRGYYGKKFSQSDNMVISWMFYRGNPYDNRIKMAKEEMGQR